jgi:hypothetical protein
MIAPTFLGFENVLAPIDAASAPAKVRRPGKRRLARYASNRDCPDVVVETRTKRRRLPAVWRAVLETGFIIFLFYSNLLMGEFTRSNGAHGKTLSHALIDIFTLTNFTIAVISALIGYVVVEYLRRKL